jgi:RNA polymerase sigma factor (sigma-70 family)
MGMATTPMSEVLQHLRGTAFPPDGAGLTDGQLLERYVRGREAAALAALVRRHGPMVWGVCRRVLANYHDAEDAFQATFLVLARKAAAIAARELLANWLYGVAYQTARKARATAAKRRARERQVREMPEPAAAPPDLWPDLRPLLDQELSRLPDKYRVVIVLCDLEGKARKEAARQIGVPEGTVAGWLARARVLLAKRLAQRGVALSGGALAAALSQEAASAGAPASVTSATIQAAGRLAAGQTTAAGVISVKVAALTEGVLQTMLLTKRKVVLALLVVAALSGVAGLIYQTQAAEQPTAQRATEKADKAKPPAAPNGGKRTDRPEVRGNKQVLPAQWEWFTDKDKAVLPPLRPVITLIPAVKSEPGIKNFMLSKDDRGSLEFSVCLLPRPKALKTADLTTGVPLAPPLFVDRASSIIVDGTLKAVQKNEDTTITIVLTASTLATVDKVAIDGALRAKAVKVTIDGKPGKLTDLTVGMSISMQVAKVSDQEAAIEIRAGKAVESLQPKSH